MKTVCTVFHMHTCILMCTAVFSIVAGVCCIVKQLQEVWSFIVNHLQNCGVLITQQSGGGGGDGAVDMTRAFGVGDLVSIPTAIHQPLCP